MSTSSLKRQIRRFHVVVVQWTSKKCNKKRDARAKLFFWSRRCGRRRSCLSSDPNVSELAVAAFDLVH